MNDPAAPIAHVAERAGVGIAALYRRYGSKEALLGTLCLVGQDRYLEEAERALADDGDPWAAYEEWLRRIVDADTHSLTVSLAGTFTPGPEHANRAERMDELTTELFERTRASGRLRPDVTRLDVAFLLELLAQVKLGDAQRTAELRQRQPAIIVDGLRARGQSELPGSAPTWQEQAARWVRHTPEG